MQQMDREIQWLFVLLRAALHANHPVELPLGVTPDWPRLYRLASEQGVLAVAWDGLLRLVADGVLSLEQQPPRMLKLQWAVNVEQIERRYAKQQRALSRLAEALQGPQFQVLVFKGLALAPFYPIPQHRECGDIDIYALNGRLKEMNHVILAAGGTMGYDSFKHAELVIGGVTIENHRCFIGGFAGRRNRLKNAALEACLVNAQPLVDGTTLLAPDARFNQLFILSHAASHFRHGELSLRQLIDWMLVLSKGDGFLDITLLKEHHMWPFAQLVNRLCVEYLGAVLPKELCDADEQCCLKVLQDMFVSAHASQKPESRWQRLKAKAKRYYARRWTYSVTGVKFWQETLYSIYAHLMHPKTIFNGEK